MSEVQYNGNRPGITCEERPQIAAYYPLEMRVMLNPAAQEAMREYAQRHEMADWARADIIAAIIAKEIL